MRSGLALLLGALVAGAVYLAGAIIGLLTVYGIPLGAEPARLNLPYLLVNLGFAAAGAGLGGWITARIGRQFSAVGVLAVSLGLFAMLGFSRPASRWPAWYPPLLAILAAGAAVGGGLLQVRRGQS